MVFSTWSTQRESSGLWVQWVPIYVVIGLLMMSVFRAAIVIADGARRSRERE